MLEVVLCDTIDEFEKRYKKISPKCEILCLTKNAELVSTCSSKYSHVEVKVLESNKNYLEYAEQVWDILDEINACISQEVVERTYLYHANCELEGYTEAMRVLDMLMFYDIFDNLFSKCKDVHVYCFYNTVYYKEIEQLYFWCKKNKKNFSLYFGKTPWEFMKLRLFVLTIFGEKALEAVIEISSQVGFRNRLTNLKRQAKDWKKEEQAIHTDIGILKQAAKEKDYNWTKDYLEQLSKEKIDFRIISVNEKIKRQWEEYGYTADNIERSINMNVLAHELKKYKRVKKKQWKKLKSYLDNYSDLGDGLQLRIIMKSHLCYDVREGLISDVAADEFFQTHSYKIIDLHANTNSIYSQICGMNAKKHNPCVKIRNCTGSFQIVRKCFYEPYGYLSDFGFVQDIDESRYSKVEKHRVESVGRKYLIKNTAYAGAFYGNSFVRESLKEELSVLWAPSYPSLGATSYSRFMRTGLTLCDFFENNTGSLRMKFHPNQRKSEINIFQDRCKKCNNIILEPMENNIRDVLKKVDILITNCSLSIMDAIVERKAVISIVCDYEYSMFEKYKEGFYVIREDDELLRLMEQLSKDEGYRKEWIEERIRVQDSYFAEVITNDVENSEQMRIIKKELKEQEI